MSDKITDQIYIGSAQDALHRPLPSGVTAILNVAQDLVNPRPLYLANITMCHIPLTDGGSNSIEMVALALQCLDALIHQGEVVLVHCHEGKSRSVGVVAAWLAGVAFDEEGNSVAQDISEAEMIIKEHRPRADINSDLRPLLIAASKMAGWT